MLQQFPQLLLALHGISPGDRANQRFIHLIRTNIANAIDEGCTCRPMTAKWNGTNNPLFSSDVGSNRISAFEMQRYTPNDWSGNYTFSMLAFPDQSNFTIACTAEYIKVSPSSPLTRPKPCPPPTRVIYETIVRTIVKNVVKMEPCDKKALHARGIKEEVTFETFTHVANTSIPELWPRDSTIVLPFTADGGTTTVTYTTSGAEPTE